MATESEQTGYSRMTKGLIGLAGVLILSTLHINPRFLGNIFGFLLLLIVAKTCWGYLFG